MIRIILMDVDGVLTDGKVIIDSLGNEFKTIDFRDIDAIFEMKRQGLKVGLLTGEDTPMTLFFRERFKPDFFYNGCKDKTSALNQILAQTGASDDEVCYVGDGKYDIAIMKRVEFRASPANAIPEVRELSNIVLERNGGDGCIWELMEWVKKRNNRESKNE
jgi:YrbI family 3-deoxy-D-manno-octulosonate 8-phosphate phosphatase